jgi:ubiquitin-protein ligase
MSRFVKKKVTEKSRVKALKGNFKRATIKQPHDHIKYIIPDDSDIGVWYFMLGAKPDFDDNEGEFAGDDDEFLGGQFIGKIMATKVYPYGPPNVKMLTPTGVFPLNNSNFCIDIGKYHKDNYPATLGMDGYVNMIWSGLIGWKSLGSGINLLTARNNNQLTLANIRKASTDSKAYNEEHIPEVIAMFRDSYGKKDLADELDDMAL